MGERIARERVIPYFARRKIPVPEKLEDWVDISRDTICRLESEPLTRTLKDTDNLLQEVDWPGQKLSQADKKKLG